MIKLLFYIIVLMLQVPLQATLFSHDRAVWLMQKGQYGSAKDLLAKQLSHANENPELLYDLGVATYKASNNIISADEQSDAQNTNAQTTELLASKAYFEKVTQLDNASGNLKEKSYFNAGNVAVDLNKLQEAIDHYEKALKINPENKQTKHNLEKVKEMLNKQQQEQKNQQDKQEQNKDNKDQNQQKNNKDKQQKNNQDKQENDQDKQENDQDKDQQQKDGDNKQDQDKKDSEQKDQKNKNEKQQEKQKDQQNQSNDQKQSQDEQQQDKEEQDQKKQQQDKNDRDKKEREEQKKEAQSAGEKDAKQKEEQAKQNAQAQQEREQQEPEKKMDAWLTRILNEQEKKDAALNKQMIRATVDKKLAGNDGQNCW